ncbi:MAG TPA: PEP/pyruvate-binding domain-containing protein [Patescibacteria group bacterium]|nr:PEP/pyruvate-binding domain-containing protein [Patescibacteria group bacterium]
MPFTRPFSDLSKNDTHLAGGKGASLGEMTQAGIPVPPGFVVLAPSFDQFLRETNLVQEIEAQLDQVNYEDVASVERASRVIHDLIHDARFPRDIEEEVLTSFRELNAKFVAVRSSATAEDSSTASWAGELESYLNTTEKTLLGNVKKCWASLFTPRAIVYRNEKGMRKSHVSVAVVIQKMVNSEISGICFTVHPVTKDPNQMIIESCWGLGEYIVGGVVTPDSYVLDKRDGTLLDVNVSEQEIMLARRSPREDAGGLIRKEDGGNEQVRVPQDKRTRQKIDGGQIRKLADICQGIEKHYGFPCDIEWAQEAGVFFITQSRPVTTL